MIGGFQVPQVYRKSQRSIESKLSQADIDYAELTRWSFPDEFLCFVMKLDFLGFVSSSYPNPRQKNEVPIWFLVSCQFVMRLHQSVHYRELRYLLNAGSLLTRFGYNVGSSHVGFNDKNRQPRKTVIHDDTVRKFFKDTDALEIRSWYHLELQQWFASKRVYHDSGLFVLDQTHIVVPDNKHYQDAVRMPVDEHGQLYARLGSLTAEQKASLVYHPCYALSLLLHVTPHDTHYHVSGYEFGAGNTDELVQARELVPSFCRAHPGVMKELIIDRGYIDGVFFSELKEQYGVDVMVPLRKSMSSYQDALKLVENDWEVLSEKSGKTVEVAGVPSMDLWSSATCPQQVAMCRESTEDGVRYLVLACTKRYKKPADAIKRYQLRVQIEERFRQLKHGWNIGNFPSPHKSLIESHVCFTLLTYSLLQLYLNRNDLQEQTKQMIASLRKDERTGKDAVMVYSKDEYGIFDLDDFMIRVTELEDDPRRQINALMKKQKENRLLRG